MVEAKLLRKKLKNGLIVDKWDLVTIIEKQQAEIEKLKADSKRLDWIWNEAQYCCFKLEKVRLFTVATQHFTNVYGIRPMIDEAMELAILRKAQEK
jgi:hypothetical protein